MEITQYELHLCCIIIGTCVTIQLLQMIALLQMLWKLGQIKSTLAKEPSTILPTIKSVPTNPVTRTKQSKMPLQVFQLMLTSAILVSIMTFLTEYSDCDYWSYSIANYSLSFLFINDVQRLFKLQYPDAYLDSKVTLITAEETRLMGRHLHTKLTQTHQKFKLCVVSNMEATYISMGYKIGRK